MTATTGEEFKRQTDRTRQWTMLATYSVNDVTFGRVFPLVRPHRAAAGTATTAAGLGRDAATSITPLELKTAEGNRSIGHYKTAA